MLKKELKVKNKKMLTTINKIVKEKHQNNKSKQELLHNKIIVGPVEHITIKTKKEKRKFECRIDTGAASSSIHSGIVAEMKLGPALTIKKIRNSHGESLRPVIELDIIIKNKKMKVMFTVTDRSKMKYPVLIGRNVLKHGFLIDLSKE